MKHIVFLDTETTGLDYNDNQILQLSYIICKPNGEIIKAKNFYLDVDVEIEAGASDTHGITKERIIKLSQGKKFKDIAAEVFWDLSDNKIICHNANFDISFIKEEFSRLNKNLNVSKDSFCTMEYYTDILKIHNYYGYKWPKLEEVINYLKIDRNELLKEAKKIFDTNDNIEFHDARLDVYSTYVIYHTMLTKSLNLYNKIVKNITEKNIEGLLKLDINDKTINIDELKPLIKELDSYKKIVDYEFKIETAVEELEISIKKLEIIKTLIKESRKDNPSYSCSFQAIDDDDIPF